MNCPECNGKTAVVDSRNVRRRRKCLACGHRFTTFEVLAGAHGIPAEEPKPKKPKPVKPVEPKVSAVKRAANARRRIEALREMSFLDPDYDYLPENW